MDIKDMDKNERSLLLFFETCVVDFTGRVDARRMNQIDEEIAQRWNKEGFLEYGRIAFKDHNSQGSKWVEFTEETWTLAHQERRARFERSERRFRKTSEL